jgi:hypothetical protein
MPLSKTLCFIGHFYGPGREGKASSRTIGFINHITETAAEDFVYSTDDEYYVSADGEYGLENGDAYRRDLGVSSPRL